MKRYGVTLHENRLGEMDLMRGNNICLYGKKWKFIPKYSQYPFFTVLSTSSSVIIDKLAAVPFYSSFNSILPI